MQKAISSPNPGRQLTKSVCIVQVFQVAIYFEDGQVKNGDK
jgi:hypothetical protein